MSTGLDRKVAGDVCRVAGVAVFFVAATVFLEKSGIRNALFDVETFRSLLQGGSSGTGRMVSAAIFVVGGAGVIALGMPRLWASAVGGVVYGALMGTVLSVMASILGASILYLAGRSLLGRVVERRLGGRLEFWRRRFHENAFWWVLYGRLVPFSNSTIMSLLCGSCRVPFWAYVQGSVLGFIPLAAVFAAFGSGGLEGNLGQIGFAVLVLAAFVILRRLINARTPVIADEKTVDPEAPKG
ncbi:MAG: TVP38/TMEM64 family protein [Desulfomonilia bacterium]|uniref:VTT domain-containing protein n=1 Tax=anaerobic digester metagenome TaxID=1263854 RepID=A0A485LX87_9ZZZZ|nr:VTT domain-containing protein [Pseudomonadota bacterium]HON38734.1 VTT domain-containing protein [Deltaproteobacteria bacterium]HRS56595.1 VTT domain-containing protein [Desulfomonilia bacterium]HPD21897.1 VTT domain-containing protein [Deltaproteobacteria bacterium]HPX18470.1 VTT domain-containing protein [Deltaproteobacteria bacterium]